MHMADMGPFFCHALAFQGTKLAQPVCLGYLGQHYTGPLLNENLKKWSDRTELAFILPVSGHSVFIVHTDVLITC